ncbi:probable proline iminopeptidase isoform X2 [Dysidea avara]|uniref:probable proline iminopeptidase isoform X2 n=1 Tax=Dysidea avara TaxID=196820 RepID=UPI0033278EB3
MATPTTNQDKLRERYPPIEPYQFSWLNVSQLHTIYYEQCGNPNGVPVVVLHGGPGGGCSMTDRQYFDPNLYRIILYDQRGAGRSRPQAEIKENTTWHLIEDMETLRKHLNIDQWMLFGGSWGATLSLLYAQTHPDHVLALIIRGVFAIRRSEVEWLYQSGASHIFPDYWEEFIGPIPEVERHNLVEAYYRRLTGDNEEVQMKCARAWSCWECRLLKMVPDLAMVSARVFNEQSKWPLAFAKIECHYFVHGGWLETDDHIFRRIDKIRHIPGVIVQGRYDMVCPSQTAWQLHKLWPEAELHMVLLAGHSSTELGITSKLIETTDKFGLSFKKLPHES